MILLDNLCCNLEKKSADGKVSGSLNGKEAKANHLQKMRSEEKKSVKIRDGEEGVQDFSLLLLTEKEKILKDFVPDEKGKVSEKEILCSKKEEVNDSHLKEFSDQETTDLLLLNQIMSPSIAKISDYKEQEQPKQHSLSNTLAALSIEVDQVQDKAEENDGVHSFENSSKTHLEEEAQKNTTAHTRVKLMSDARDDMKIVEKNASDGKNNLQSAPLNLSKIDIGDKVAFKQSNSVISSQTGLLNGVEIIQSKKTATLTLLHLKLDPAHFGTVEAKIRTSNDGIHVDLRTENKSAAHALEQDQHFLTQILEKVGFGGDRKIHVHIAQHVESITPIMTRDMQQAELSKQNHADFNAFSAEERGAFSQNRGGSSQSERENMSENSWHPTEKDLSLKEHPRAYRDSRRLIV